MIIGALRKIGEGICVVLVVLAVSFLLFQYAGDPVAGMLGQDADMATRAQLRHDLGLDRSAVEQFVRYLWRVLHGDLGFSFQYHRPVAALIFERLPATLELCLISGIVSIVAGIGVGIFAAVYRRSIGARTAELAAVGGISLPPFVVALLLILLFSAEWKVLPAFGRGEVVKLGWWQTGLLTQSGRDALVLPVASLAAFQIALIMRLTRSQMSAVLSQDYIRFARARGLPGILIAMKHALRNALAPVLTVAGLQLGSIIAFSVVTETVFQWPGVGLLFIQAVTFADFPLLAGYLMIVSAIFVLLNLATDAVVSLVDPRSRLAAGAA